jgi:3-isopropylmalate/(R)-2-methylmalate dehydratase small subunit
MQPFTTLTAVAAPLEMKNVNTDMIIPARYLMKARGPGYERYLFNNLRYETDGREKPDFVLNQTPYRNAQILVADANFGCGSSREAAVYALLANGIRSVIAPSFGDIHYGNELQNGMLPAIVPEATVHALCEQLRARPGAELAIDLAAQTITDPAGTVHRFTIDPQSKERLLKGLDDIGLILQHAEAIAAFEQRHRAALPWLA